MKNIFHIYICAIVTLITINDSFAQTEGTLHFMKSIPQVVYSNPAIVPKYKFSLGLPGSSVMTYYSNNGFSFNHLVSQTESGSTVDLKKFSEKIAERNFITNAVQVDLFRLSFRTGDRFFWTSSLSTKTYTRIMIPKGMFGIIAQGTSSFIGNELSISPQLEVLSYLESAIGTSFRITEHFVVGFNAKFLKGLANITTLESDVRIMLDEDYNFSTRAVLNVKSSGIYNVSQGAEFNQKNYLKNNGFAFDIGVRYRILDRINFGVSLIDVGAITWKNDLQGFTLNQEASNFTFEGINIDSLLAGNTNFSFDTDSLRNGFTPTRTAIGKYSSALPTKAYLSTDLELTSTFTVGGVLYFERMNDRIMPAITLGANKHFGKRISTAISYTIANRSYNNLGAGLSLNFAPLQFYVLGDNLLGAPIALAYKQELNPYLNTLKYFNIRMGLNIAWGWRDQLDRNIKRR